MLQVTIKNDSEMGSSGLSSMFIYTYIGTVWQKEYCGLLTVFFTQALFCPHPSYTSESWSASLLEAFPLFCDGAIGSRSPRETK